MLRIIGFIMYLFLTFYLSASTTCNEELKQPEISHILRSQHSKICSRINLSKQTLNSLATDFFSNGLIDQDIKMDIYRSKTVYEGADTLMDHAIMKVNQDPKNLDKVLQIMNKQESLCDIVENMREKHKGNSHHCIKIRFMQIMIM